MTRRHEPNYHAETKHEEEMMHLEAEYVRKLARENPGCIIHGAEHGSRSYVNPDADSDGDLHHISHTEKWTRISGNGMIEKRVNTVRWATIDGDKQEMWEEVVSEYPSAEEGEEYTPTKTEVEPFVNDSIAAKELFEDIVPDDVPNQKVHVSDWDGLEEAMVERRKRKQQEHEPPQFVEENRTRKEERIPKR